MTVYSLNVHTLSFSLIKGGLIRIHNGSYVVFIGQKEGPHKFNV